MELDADAGDSSGTTIPGGRLVGCNGSSAHFILRSSLFFHLFCFRIYPFRMAYLMICVFVIGYLAIAFEHSIRINKAATALVTGVLCWTIYILSTGEKQAVSESLSHELGGLSQIL